ncbi:LapA family protein [Tuberibacillus calidus]|uniref:LapA family protein n=1 Tax=Tuberibacillus calidus TaxID=340097 RepID=UPI00041F2598|nr:lipopolysaccharide assembly protein LapA domain-containing protein [Tuberibacillus calidus]
MKGPWAFILAIFLALVIAIFSVANVNPVTFNYVFGQAKWPLILIILGSAFLGALFIGVIGAVRFYQLERQIKRLERERQGQSHSGETKTGNSDKRDSNE